MVKYKNGDVSQSYPCGISLMNFWLYVLKPLWNSLHFGIKIITLRFQTLSVKWAAYRFFFLSGHKLFLNFRRTLNLRSLTRTWFLEKLDSNHCRELQGHRGNKRVNKYHGTCLDRKPFFSKASQWRGFALICNFGFFYKKKKKKKRRNLSLLCSYIRAVFFFSLTKTEWFTTDAVIKRFLFFHRKGF